MDQERAAERKVKIPIYTICKTKLVYNLLQIQRPSVTGLGPFNDGKKNVVKRKDLLNSQLLEIPNFCNMFFFYKNVVFNFTNNFTLIN